MEVEVPIVLEILNNKVGLDARCWCCKGKGRPDKSQRPSLKGFILPDGSCEVCRGVGWELTDEGRAIINLVRRHEPEKL